MEVAVLQGASAVRAALRRLWADHAAWMRQHIAAIVAGTPDGRAAMGRLLESQDGIGNAIAPYCGRVAGAQLSGLLKEHALVAADLAATARTGDEKEFARHGRRWSDNAAAIAAFLEGANPQWRRKEITDLLLRHLASTRSQMVARVRGRWEDDAKAFDDALTTAMAIADALADGLVRQFPAKLGAAA